MMLDQIQWKKRHLTFFYQDMFLRKMLLQITMSCKFFIRQLHQQRRCYDDKRERKQLCRLILECVETCPFFIVLQKLVNNKLQISIEIL